jgi:hypothetical protein
MKGIAHFASAVALASFLPEVVSRSAQGSFVLLLAGLGALLPDALDFRLARFLPRPDVVIGAGPGDAGDAGMDPKTVAECLAGAIKRAHQSGHSAYVRLDPVRVGLDLWQQYSVCFDRGQVWVRRGPTVDGAQRPVEDETCDGFAPVALSPTPIRQADDAAVVVDVFSGTALEFRPCGERVEIVFLPWHRRWSHSLPLAVCLGGGIALLLGPLAGLVFFLGVVTHILEDQLGHMGSNLLYPFTRRRTRGLRLYHSGDALPNLFVIWLSAVLLLVNLDRFSPAPVFEPWRLLSLGFVIPWAVIGAWRWWRQARERGRPRVASDSEAERSWVDVSHDGERRAMQGQQIDD